MKVGIIGTGKLGGPVSEVFAESGHEVFAYDIAGGKNIKVTEEGGSRKYYKTIKSVVQRSAIVFVAVPTPHSEEYDGSSPCMDLEPKDFDYSIVKEVLTEINKHASSHQHVVLISTVLPGTIREQLLPLIDNCTLLYNPYLIAMGTVKEDFKKPEMIMVGTENGLTIDHPMFKTLIRFYLSCTEFDSGIDAGGYKSGDKREDDPQFLNKFVLGTYEEIECVKVFYNTFISSKISFVNMIQDVAERQGNIDVDVVTNALTSASTRIISPAYMKAGMGDGGACHPRDNIALRWMSDNLDLGYDIFDAIMEAREIQAKNIAIKLLEPGLPVVIVGKAYKPHVHYVDGSYSILVGHYVEELGGTVYYDDDYTGDKPPADLGAASYLLGHDPESAFLGCLDPDPDKEESSIFPEGSVIIDPWRKCPDIPGCTVVHYGNTRFKRG